MERVILESPYAGNLLLNRAYLDVCILDCFMRDEAPFASHLMYTSALDDTDPAQRSFGIEAGFAQWVSRPRVVFFTDLGITRGMYRAIRRAKEFDIQIEFRSVFSTLDIASAAESFLKSRFTDKFDHFIELLEDSLKLPQ